MLPAFFPLAGYDKSVLQCMALPGLMGGGFGATEQPQMCHNPILLPLHPYGGHTSQLGLMCLGQKVSPRGCNFVCRILVGKDIA